MAWFLSQGPASVFDPCPSLQTTSFFSVWVYAKVDGNISTSVTQSSGGILLLNQRTPSSWGRQWRSHPSGGWLVLPGLQALPKLFLSSFSPGAFVDLFVQGFLFKAENQRCDSTALGLKLGCTLESPGAVVKNSDVWVPPPEIPV